MGVLIQVLLILATLFFGWLGFTALSTGGGEVGLMILVVAAVCGYGAWKLD